MNDHPRTSYGVTCDLVTEFGKKVFLFQDPATRLYLTPTPPEYFVAPAEISQSC
jgi:hypothetical protein